MNRRYLLATVALIQALSICDAGTLEVTVPGRAKEAVGWCAASTTVIQAFAGQNLPEGTIVYYFDENAGDEGAWVTIIYEFGEWTAPDYVIGAARGFLIWNPLTVDHTYALNFTLIPGDDWSTTLLASPSGRWHFLAFPWPRHGWLELPPPPYSAYPNMNWPGRAGDLIYVWNSFQQWFIVTIGCDERLPDNPPSWVRRWDSGDGHSPYIQNWQPFFYECSETRTWIQHKNDAEP